jgi:hypothetical protein
MYLITIRVLHIPINYEKDIIGYFLIVFTVIVVGLVVFRIQILLNSRFKM